MPHTSPPDLATFQQSLTADAPPPGLEPHLLALWHDGRGDWAKAHMQVDDGHTQPACHVHAYLHRKEGDRSNARYWYARAGVASFEGTLDAEYASLLRLYLR